MFNFQQSSLCRPHASGGPDLQRRVDVQLEELEEDFPLDFAPGSVEASQLQGQVRGHPLRQQNHLFQSADYRHRRARRCDDDVLSSDVRKASEAAGAASHSQSCPGQKIGLVDRSASWQPTVGASVGSPDSASPGCHSGLSCPARTSRSDAAAASVEGLEVGLDAQGLEIGRMVQETKTKLDFKIVVDVKIFFASDAKIRWRKKNLVLTETKKVGNFF